MLYGAVSMDVGGEVEGREEGIAWVSSVYVFAIRGLLRRLANLFKSSNNTGVSRHREKLTRHPYTQKHTRTLPMSVQNTSSSIGSSVISS